MLKRLATRCTQDIWRPKHNERGSSLPRYKHVLHQWMMDRFKHLQATRYLKCRPDYTKPNWQVTEVSRMKPSGRKRPKASRCQPLFILKRRYILFSVSPVTRCWNFPVLAFTICDECPSHLWAKTTDAYCSDLTFLFYITREKSAVLRVKITYARKFPQKAK